MVSAVADSHPRIRARRESLERTGERRKWIRTGVLLGLLAVMALGLFLVRTSLLDVDQVTVLGAEQADPDLIVELAGIEQGVQLVDVDLAGVERRVERHPWVASANATREWPDTIRVDVVERVPVAASPVGASSYLLIDLEGVVLDIVPAPPRELPLVVGVDAAAAPGLVAEGLAAAVLVVDAIPADLAEWVHVVNQNEQGAVVLDLGDGVWAELGTPDQLADKLVALATLLTRVQNDCIESFNVQAPDAPVVTRCLTSREAVTEPET
ncbi:MAG: cell division protein FtsQ/DivIB [Acidimicrobiales bacterium]